MISQAKTYYFTLAMATINHLHQTRRSLREFNTRLEKFLVSSETNEMATIRAQFRNKILVLKADPVVEMVAV